MFWLTDQGVALACKAAATVYFKLIIHGINSHK
jgi:hypothetical protein